MKQPTPARSLRMMSAGTITGNPLLEWTVDRGKNVIFQRAYYNDEALGEGSGQRSLEWCGLQQERRRLKV